MRFPDPTLSADPREIDEEFRALCISAVQEVKKQTNALIDAVYAENQDERAESPSKQHAQRKRFGDSTDGREQLVDFIKKSEQRPRLYKWKVMGATSAHGVLIGFMVVNARGALAFMVWVDLEDEETWQVRAQAARRLK